MERLLSLVTSAAAALLLVPSAALAQQLPATQLSVVEQITQHGTAPVTFPFWRGELTEKSGGAITVQMQPQEVAGIDGADILRLLGNGVFDIGAGEISKVAVDDPVFEGCDLAGLTFTIEQTRAACEAWKPTMDRVMQEKFNAKLLALSVSSTQVFWCRIPVSGLADLKGQKVRVFNKSMTDFLESVGATSVSMPFPEVLPALERGVVDCGVTGRLGGNLAGWIEVTTHQLRLPMGWAVSFHAINLDKWNSLDQAVQQFLEAEFDALEDRMWEELARKEDLISNCTFGKQPCEGGKIADLVEVLPSESDSQLHKSVMQEVVLKRWAERAGEQYIADWNGSVGEVVGMQIQQ